MWHRFQIVKHMPASQQNVIANYLDLEHIPVHRNILSCEVLSETRQSACMLTTVRVFGKTYTNTHYLEFRPPNQVLQVARTPLGTMQTLATIEECDSDTEDIHCLTTVSVQIDLNPVLYHTSRWWVEQLLRSENRRVLDEDIPILRRRQKLFGSSARDYFRPEQSILFKELLFETFYGSLDKATQQ